MSHDKPRKRRPTLSQSVLLALGLGIAFGLFFGEYSAPLQLIGDVFIGLLQMTVLPYIVVALIVNIGSLEADKAKSMAKWAVLAMLALWLLTVLMIVVLPLALPQWESGAFFSTSLIEPRERVDFLKLYLPINPFESLAFNLVPAVVLFCIAVGVALIGAKDADGLIAPLRVALNALGRITAWVAQLTPIGVFALAASAAGTMTISQFSKLQGYIILYVAAAIILAFVAIPALVAAVTPFRMRDVVRVSRAAVLTALATDNVFIVLPQLTEAAHELFKSYRLETDESENAIEVATPLAFPFPNAGRLLAMIFIPFAAWYVGRSIPAVEYPTLIVTGIGSLFAKVTIAIPFLLDLVELPVDLFSLFLLSGVLAGRFNSLAGAMHLFAFTLLVAAGVTGLVRLRHRQLLKGAAVTVACMAVTMISTHGVLNRALEKLEGEESIIRRMRLLGEPVPATILERPEANPVPLAEGQGRLDRIRSTGRIRVGFAKEKVPFTYFNGAGELVGFDIEMAHALARGLGVELVLVPVGDPSRLSEELEADHYDVLMLGAVGTANRYREFLFSDSYLDLTPALVVRDHERERFDTAEEVSGDIKLAVIDEKFLIEYVASRLPEAEIIPVSSQAAFFEGEAEGAEALLTTAEEGSALTLLHPDFHIVTPWKEGVKWPAGYVVSGGDTELRDYLDRWIQLEKLDGTIDELYDHWILGRTALPPQPRWSVIRNVLHRVE